MQLHSRLFGLFNTGRTQKQVFFYFYKTATTNPTGAKDRDIELVLFRTEHAQIEQCITQNRANQVIRKSDKCSPYSPSLPSR